MIGAMRARLRRLVSIGLLFLQVTALAGLPAWRVHAAVPGAGEDFCTTSAERGVPVPQSPSPSHPTHACGDCCLAWGDAPPPAPFAERYPAPPRDRVAGAEATVATASRACVLPPACGPPSRA